MGIIAVVGLGYIGLPTAAVLAGQGRRVIGVDVNSQHVDAVNRGEVPFVEPDLGALVASAVDQGNLSAQKSVPPAEIFIIAVPTPLAADGAADLSYIDSAVDAIAAQLRGGEVIILESTSPPGTTQRVADRIVAMRSDLAEGADEASPVVDVAYCPERVLPGQVLVELVENDRIVGGLTPRASQRAKELYETFCRGEILVTDAATAELAKLTENAYRDVNIAFANELSVISDRVGVDVFELIRLVNHHPRVNVLQPGPGVGGHCIAVDPWFIVSSSPEEARLIRTAREVNDAKPDFVVAQVERTLEGVTAPVIAALGLAFKADIDDLRESPAVDVVSKLADRHSDARILAVEPHIHDLPGQLRKPNVELCSLEQAMDRANCFVLLVDHRQFRDLDVDALRGRPLVDTRGAVGAKAQNSVTGP